MFPFCPESRQQAQECTIVVLGASGVGKSAVLNTLAADTKLFEVAASAHAVTEETLVKKMPCPRTGVNLRLVDTQGTMDTKGRDAEFVRDIQDTIKQLLLVHAFVFVLHGQNTRMVQYVDTLKTFRKMLGSQFMSNVIFCFTHMPSFASGSAKKKTKAKKAKEEKEEAISQMLRDELQHSGKIPCVFFDNEVTFDGDEADDEDKDELDSNVKQLFDFASNVKPYHSSSVSEDSVLTSADATKAKEVGSEATRTLLEQFEKKATAVRADESQDSFYQYAVIAESQDQFVDNWIEEVAEHGEHVYDIFDQFKQAMRNKLEQLRLDIFGAQFVARQQSLITQVCGTRDALRKCPFCGIVWWNEGGCEQRRCGHQGAPNWSQDLVEVLACGRNKLKHGCGRKVEWPMAKPVSQEEIKSALKPHTTPALRGSKQVPKEVFKTRARDSYKRKKAMRKSKKRS